MKRKIIFLICSIFLIIILCGAILFWRATKNIYHIDNSKFVTIEPNDGLFQISDKVEQSEIIRNMMDKSSFIFYSILTGKSRKFQPGKHYFGPDYSIANVVNGLAKTPIEEIKLTIPEGWRATQIGEKLEELQIAKKADFLTFAIAKEGYLFPDTYMFTKNTDPEKIVLKMETNFSARTKELNVNKQVLIIASLVEREAKLDEDRAGVAAVFYNRLEKNMKFEADSTIQYALGNWEEISSKDLKINSPYNTYFNSGLPPTPICNPGIKSIEAALNPAASDNLFFINAPGGKAYFAKTKAEHDANIKKYLK
ncbi:MAG: endolytic transglycosylase MltG [Patescibacteria group bacterium]|jgi:UPF0755 protein